jgi:hypothetical protein
VLKENFYGPRRLESAAAPAIPRCSALAELQLVVEFPDCWNGKSLDSANHRSHMAYSRLGACPGRYPVAVPALELVYNYLPPSGRELMLSSGGQFSGHADFVNSWSEPALTKLVDDCLNRGRVCGLGVVSSSAR